MTTTIDERCIHLEFSDQWDPVVKYDDHSWYRKRVEPKLKGVLTKGNSGSVVEREESTRGIDVVAKRGDVVLLMEIKDFRGHDIENRSRLRGDLALEVALKVRDTVACMVGASLTASEPEVWRALTRGFAGPGAGRRNPVHVVLLLAMDDSGSKHGAAEIGALTDKLSQKLSWLSRKVQIVEPRLVGERFPGINVKVDRQV